MTGVIATIPKFQFSANGIPMVGGTLDTYIAGSTTPTDTWQDSALTVANTNPITLDARGECVLWLDSAVVYKFVLKNAAGVIQWTQDNISTPAALVNTLRTDLAASSGASLVGTISPATGGIDRTQADKNSDAVTVKDFGGTWDGVADVSTVAQAALDSGAKVVDFMGLSGKIVTALTIPAGIEARNVNLTAGTAGMNMLLVNSRSRVSGTLTGTGTTSIVERGIYPAADGVEDVHLDVIVQNMTFGVHAQYLGTDAEANFPRRWTGTIRCKNIVGAIGKSEGYGVLLSPALDCNLKIFGKTIQRHALYLSAGASNNIIDVDVDGCKNVAYQINTSATQAASQYNTVCVKARNLTVPGDPQGADQVNGVHILGNSHRNTTYLDIDGNGTAEMAIVCEGVSTDITMQPTGNKFYGHIKGGFVGKDVVRDIGCAQNDYSGLSIDANATFSVIAFRLNGARASAALPWAGPRAYDNQINAQGVAIRGIYNEVTDVATYIGPNDIRNNSTSLRVDDRTDGKRTGYSRRCKFSGTTASAAATTSIDTTVTLPIPMQVLARNVDVKLTGSSVQFFDKPICIVGVIAAADETSLGFRAYNGHSAAQTLSYTGTVEGD